jgi:flavin reductase (DIM6/NTAB) family NADH-FMN oxidoreductase RutF
MVAGWNMRCSRVPPLLAVSLQKRGHTHKLIRQSREFVVAVPNKGLEREVRFFGSAHGNEVDKFKETGIATEKAKFLKSPLLKKATINFECKLEKEVEAGDHIIFVGRVLAARVSKNKGVLMNMGWKEGERVFEEF